MDEQQDNAPKTDAPEDSKPERVDRAAAAGLPSEHGPEVRVIKLRPAMFRARRRAGARRGTPRG